MQTLPICPLTALIGAVNDLSTSLIPRAKVEDSKRCHVSRDWLWASCGLLCLILPGSLTSSSVLSPPTWWW